MTEELQLAQEHLKDLEAFIGSRVHTHFVNARKTEIITVQERILLTPPITVEDIASVNTAHGELDCLAEMTKTFEDARVTLKARISEMVERENQNATAQKV